MLQATSIILDNSNDIVCDSVTLDFDGRCRRRCTMVTDGGREFLLNLSEAIILNHGDILQLSDGSSTVVKSADEDVLDIRSDNPMTLAEVAWSLGNMHRPIEIATDYLRTRYDRLIEHDYKMLAISLTRNRAPFTPKKSH